MYLSQMTTNNLLGNNPFGYKLFRITHYARSLAVIMLISLLAPAPLSAQSSSYSETQLISRAEAALTELKTIQAEFIQISSNGSVGEGLIYFRRPVQLRLDYKNPETLTLVTSSTWLYVDDKIAKIVQAFPISQTPFYPLLEETIRFQRPDIITRAKSQDGIATISLIKEDGEGAGQLDLEFETSTWRLRRWIIIDALGISTEVTLQNPIYNQKLENKLFGVPAYNN